jgi:hypothetical protein
MPDAKELLYSNLHEVFSERDPERRRPSSERMWKTSRSSIQNEKLSAGKR